MSQFKFTRVAIVMLFPAVVHAGQIYGSITSGGKGVAKAGIEILCGGVTSPSTTAADGSYRINIVQQGQCTLTLPGYAGRPSAVVFSNPNPAAYNFELVQRGAGYELQRR